MASITACAIWLRPVWRAGPRVPIVTAASAEGGEAPIYTDTSKWIREAIGQFDLPSGGRVVDLGSSTEHYRTVEQPHVERDVMAPLRERGLEIVHVDAKDAPGVDVVQDLDHATVELAERLGPFDLVLCVGLLAYVREPMGVIAMAAAMAGPGGYVVSTTPESYRRTLDPRDNMWRPSSAELATAYEQHGLARVRTESVRIDDPRYYRGLLSRASWVPVGGRVWLPLPGFSERLRLRMPRARWSESCVTLRRP